MVGIVGGSVLAYIGAYALSLLSKIRNAETKLRGCSIANGS